MFLSLFITALMLQAVDRDEFLTLLPQVVDSVEAYIDLDEPSATRRKLLISLESFATAARIATGEQLAEWTIRGAIARDFTNSAEEEAIECAQPGFPCWVREDGVFVQLDLVTRRQGSLVAYVNVVTTSYGGPQKAVCPRLLRMSFFRIRAVWVLFVVQPIEVC